MNMGPEKMQPFIVETINVFNSLLGVMLRETRIETKDMPQGTFEVSAVIGLSGSWTGTLVLSCPQNVACRIISRMVREPVETLDADVSDGMGELVNILAGNACRHLTELGGRFVSLTVPTVIVGQHRIVWRSRDLPCLMMKFFDSDLGPLCIEVNLHATVGGPGEAP
jgi:chemotaxis protein CheX